MTAFSFLEASVVADPKRERASFPPITVNSIYPFISKPGGFHWTAWIDVIGILFTPLPTDARARNPERSIVTNRPSKWTVPLCPLAEIISEILSAVETTTVTRARKHTTPETAPGG